MQTNLTTLIFLQSEILDTFPEQKDILSWVKAAFGVPAGHQEWKTVEEKGTLFHEIVGKYAVNGTVILPRYAYYVKEKKENTWFFWCLENPPLSFS